MKKLTLIIGILICLPLSLVYGNSPVTTTDFSRAYDDIDIVKQAREGRVLTEGMADYLVSRDNAIDVKAAIINALSFQGNPDHKGGSPLENLRYFSKYLMAKKEKREKKFDFSDLSFEEIFLFSYLELLVDYDRPRPYVQQLEIAAKRLNDSYTVAVILGLARAQEAVMQAQESYTNEVKQRIIDGANYKTEDNQIFSDAITQTLIDEWENPDSGRVSAQCLTWLEYKEAIESEGLKQDMRSQAKQIIEDYMKSFKPYCDDAGKFWEVSETRG